MEKKMETTTMGYMGGCQNYGPFLGTLNIRCRTIIGIQKGIIILTTTLACGETHVFLLAINGKYRHISAYIALFPTKNQ